MVSEKRDYCIHSFSSVINSFIPPHGVLSKEYGMNILYLEYFDTCSSTSLPDIIHDPPEVVRQHLLQLQGNDMDTFN